MNVGAIPSYGIRERVPEGSQLEAAAESLRLLGYAVVPSGHGPDEVAGVSAAFDAAMARQAETYGREALVAINEHNTLRAALAYDAVFVDLARNASIMALCDVLIGGQVQLNQQNGISNPPNGQNYNQGSYHRDLPYQHFTSSRPLALNALYCVDEFTRENGATYVVPGSHKEAAFPSEATIRSLQVQVSAPAGSFIVLDCMTYHSGGVNRTDRVRRGVNHVYTIPPIKQQLSLPDLLGESFTQDPDLRRLLGYGFGVPVSVGDYYAERRTKSAAR